jgi:hypothetical protein
MNLGLCRLRVFENSELRIIFGPKTDEIIEGRRKLHNGELHNLYFWPNVIRKTKSLRLYGQGM